MKLMHQTQPSKQSLFQALSIDVVLGSLSTGLFAVKLLQVKPLPIWWLILPLSVWSIYTLDHLIDGFKKKGQSNIFRHLFHYRNGKWLITAIIVTASLSTFLSVVYLEKEIIYGGILLFLLVLMYLFVVHSIDKFKIIFFQKELTIAFVYVSGIFLAPLIWSGSLPPYSAIVIISILLVLAWLEGIIVAYFDYEADKLDGHHSFTIWLGKKKSRKAIFAMGIVASIIIALSIFMSPTTRYKMAFGIELLMLFALMLIMAKPHFFKKNQLFRWVGEGVFYLPGVLALFT